MSHHIYTAEQRARRDETVWTPVQGILAATQFVIFAVSLILVIRFLITDQGYWIANASVILKTAILLTIMVTGSIWEKVVFGQYLFAPAFFWEDVVSMGVIALHVGYVIAVVFDLGTASSQMAIALAAYCAYVINAGQFLYKFRQVKQSMSAEIAPSKAAPPKVAQGLS